MKIWENNINKFPDKFWIKFLGNFDWMILNEIFIEYKFVEHVRKILKKLNYFWVKFELHSSIVVKWAFKKKSGKLKKNSRKITKFKKKS